MNEPTEQPGHTRPIYTDDLEDWEQDPDMQDAFPRPVEATAPEPAVDETVEGITDSSLGNEEKAPAPFALVVLTTLKVRRFRVRSELEDAVVTLARRETRCIALRHHPELGYVELQQETR